MRLRNILPAFALAIAVGIPAHGGLIITPDFDVSISEQADAAAIESTIQSAIGLFESTYTNNINVSIEFYAMGSGLGESQVGFVYDVPYQEYYDQLVATNANPGAIAGLTANGGNAATNPVNNTGTILVKSADARAVGFSAPALCNVTGTEGNGTTPSNLTCSDTAGGTGAIDGLIGLNTAITYPPNPDDDSNYGLMAVTEHELDEILGLGSAIANCDPDADKDCTPAADPAPEDLFRYTADSVFATLDVTNSNCGDLPEAYLSYSGATPITNINTSCNGDDWGDWAANNPAPQVQDAVGGTGAQPVYGTSEIDAMSAIGYTLATPEPATWLLLLAPLAVVFYLRSRSTHRARRRNVC